MVAFALGCVVTRGVLVAQDRPRTTREIVQYALEQNRELQAARQRVEEAQALLRQAGVRLNPTLEFEGATGRPLGTHGEQEYSAGYFQPIETAGKRDKRTVVGQQSVMSAEAEVQQRTRQLVFDVKVRVAELRAAQAKTAALSRLLTTMQESVRLTQARVAEGDAAALEAQLLVTEVARVQAQQATYKGRTGSALTDLRRTAGYTSSAGLTLADDAPAERELVVADLQTSALAARADLKAARAGEAAALAAVAVARAEGVPDLTAFAKYTHRTSAFEGLSGVTSAGGLAPLFDRDNVLSLGLSIPLFGPHRNQGNVDAAVARSAAARLQREHLEATIPQEVESAYQRWTAARETLALFRQGVMGQSQKNLDVMRQAYELGQLRLLDVLNEQRRLIDTELSYIDAQTELAEAAADLERVVGSDLS